MDAFWGGDGEKFTELLSELLRETVSYYDYSEQYYHAFLVGVLSAFGYNVKSNDEAGDGRPDITVRRAAGDIVVIIEIKRTKDKKKLDSLADEALKQIEEKHYADSFPDYDTILRWGIAFCRKSCMAKAVMENRE